MVSSFGSATTKDAPATVIDRSRAEELALEHARAWFKVQSAHRFNLVEFWIGLTVALTAALVVAVTRSAWGVATVAALAGVEAAVAFHLFDRRARELIGDGEAALRPLEAWLAQATNIPELEILRATHRADRHASYRVVICWLHGQAAALFAFAAAYSLYRLVV